MLMLMARLRRYLPQAFAVLSVCLPARAQVYSPVVLREGQADSTDLRRLAQGIYLEAGAHTARQKAEAIWRFFLTDGRFVKPGFWYHIAGWAYEEPRGEVLDPLKLLNSYGFGLCYHVAPLLAAVFDAGGFQDSRVWFLTGHTVAEVFYDAAYHYYDSDMMGYSTLGSGAPAESVVASVRQIERDGSIITSRLKSPEVNPTLVDYPWYSADVREAAIGDLAELFTTTQDNCLYAGRRYSEGHSMSFVLRRGERMIRYFHPEEKGLYYLPYKLAGKEWSEFPQEISQYAIRTNDGPRSQKDARSWATGRIEYEPDLAADSPGQLIIEMPSPYVIIDAWADVDAELNSMADTISAETSVDGGRSWQVAGNISGPHSGPWKAEAQCLARSAHGRRTAVSGYYGYLLRLTRKGNARLNHLRIVTRFELNPRTLPELQPGENRLVYSAGPPERRTEWNISLASLDPSETESQNIEYIDEGGQGFLRPKKPYDAALLFRISSRDGTPLSGFHAGGRFLDIRNELAPDKFTAEVRKTAHAPLESGVRSAALEWSVSQTGPFVSLWTYEPEPKWLDGERIDRLLRWPEVDRTVPELPAGTRAIWVRYRLRGIALDGVRLSYWQHCDDIAPLEITQVWSEGGQRRFHTEEIEAGQHATAYRVVTGGAEAIRNEAVILTCPRSVPVARATPCSTTPAPPADHP